MLRRPERTVTIPNHLRGKREQVNTAVKIATFDCWNNGTNVMSIHIDNNFTGVKSYSPSSHLLEILRLVKVRRGRRERRSQSYGWLFLR